MATNRCCATKEAPCCTGKPCGYVHYEHPVGRWLTFSATVGFIVSILLIVIAVQTASCPTGCEPDYEACQQLSSVWGASTPISLICSRVQSDKTVVTSDENSCKCDGVYKDLDLTASDIEQTTQLATIALEGHSPDEYCDKHLYCPELVYILDYGGKMFFIFLAVLCAGIIIALTFFVCCNDSCCLLNIRDRNVTRSNHRPAPNSPRSPHKSAKTPKTKTKGYTKSPSAPGGSPAQGNTKSLRAMFGN